SEMGDALLIAMVEQNIGSIANIRGDVEGALAHYTAALERYESLGDAASALRALNNMGMAHVDLGAWGDAESCFDRAGDLAMQLQDREALGGVEISRAELYLRSGSLARARESCDRAFEIFARMESHSGLAEIHKFYGILLRESHKPLQ